MDALQFARYFPGVKASQQPRFHAAWLDVAQRFNITTPLRQAMFLANVKHETGGFRWLVELWGPTEQQKKYEPPHELALRLGNTQPGDGSRYRGRGWFQITGRRNYSLYGRRLGLELEANPEQAAGCEAGAAIAGLYWHDMGGNVLADAGNFDGVCDMINRGRLTPRIGDSNGWQERLRFFEDARAILHA